MFMMSKGSQVDLQGTDQQRVDQQQILRELIDLTRGNRPPLTEWPLDWLKPSTSPRELIHQWLSIHQELTIDWKRALDVLDDAEIRALIYEELKASAITLLSGDDDFPLFEVMINEMITSWEQERETWLQDPQLFKWWLRERVSQYMIDQQVDVSSDETMQIEGASLPDQDIIDERPVKEESLTSRGALYEGDDAEPTQGDQSFAAPEALSWPESLPEDLADEITSLLVDPDLIGVDRGDDEDAEITAPPPPPRRRKSLPESQPSTGAPAPVPPLSSPEPQPIDQSDLLPSYEEAEPPETFGASPVSPEFRGPPAPSAGSVPPPAGGSRHSIPQDYGVPRKKVAGEGTAEDIEEQLGSETKPDVQPSLDPDVDPPSSPSGEIWLDQERVRPGILERVVEKMRWLSWLLYHIFGLTTLFILHLIDNLWELVSGYINKVFQGFMNLRSVARVNVRRAEGRLIQSVRMELSSILDQSAQLLCLPYQTRDEIPWSHVARVTRQNPLALALNTRARIDDIRRDLMTLKKRNMGGVVGRGILGLAKDMIPNPLSLFRPWMNVFLLSFWMRYDRSRIHSSYQDLCEQIRRVDQLLITSEQSIYQGRSSPDLDQELNEALTQLGQTLSFFLIITLQSHIHAQPWKWEPVIQAEELQNTRHLKGLHPLPALQLRLTILSVLAELPDGHRQHRGSSRDKLRSSRRLYRQMMKLRRRSLL